MLMILASKKNFGQKYMVSPSSLAYTIYNLRIHLNSLVKKGIPYISAQRIFLRQVPSTFTISCSYFTQYEMLSARCSSLVSPYCYFIQFEIITVRVWSPLHGDRRFCGNFTFFVSVATNNINHL